MTLVEPVAGTPHIAMLLEAAFTGLRRELGGEPVPGLRVSHLRVLSHLPTAGISVTALARAVGMTKQAMGQFATFLVDGGYVVAESDPQDRRVRVLRLSDRGRGVVRLVQERMAALEDRWSDRVGKDRYATFRAVLAELGG